MSDVSALFHSLETPFGLLSNKIVMAPMTRSRAGSDWVPSPSAATYYGQRAGAGLILTEATHVSPDGMGYPRTPGVHTPDQVAGWAKVTAAVHAKGGRIACQIWHVGRVAHASNMMADTGPVSPTATPAETNVFTDEGIMRPSAPKAMNTEEIARVIREYAEGARMAVEEAGFDAIEVHGANGYLVEQFCCDGVNDRTDGYGGDIAGRLRFLDELLTAVVAAIGANRVGIRFSPYGQFNDCRDSNPEALFRAQLDLVEKHGLAYVHVIRPEISGASEADYEVDAPSVLGIAREHYSGLLIAAGGYDAEEGAQALVEGACDLVAYGRAFISNPDLPERIRTGAPLADGDRNTFYSGGDAGYIDYPALSD